MVKNNNQTNGEAMNTKRLASMVAMAVLMASSAIGYADSYDPTTGRLTVSSITIGSTEYTNVVVTVGSVVSVGSATQINSGSTCSGAFPLHGVSFTATKNASAGTISVSLTGTSTTALWTPYYWSFVQSSNSIQGTQGGALWTGTGGFSGGPVPQGVTKSGTYSSFPSWFNFSQSYVITDAVTGESATCS